MSAHRYSDLSELNHSKDRRILNEQLFFANNLRIKQTLTDLAPEQELDGYPISFNCECGDANCTDKVKLTSNEFDYIHAVERHFFVKPGHEQIDVEKVVEKCDKYYIVKKDKTV